jgi:hypothetical protein
MKDIKVDAEKFDAVLKRMIDAKPLPYKELLARPKLKKDGTPKKGKPVQKMDKPR